MRSVRYGGPLLAIVCQILGMVAQIDGLCIVAIALCVCSIAITFFENPPARAALLCAIFCLALGGIRLALLQEGNAFFIPTEGRDLVIRAGESAKRTLCGCIVALIVSACAGQLLLEILLPDDMFTNPPVPGTTSGYVTAALLALVALAACAMPAIARYAFIPASVQTVIAYFTTIATGTLICCITVSSEHIFWPMLLLAPFVCCTVLFPQPDPSFECLCVLMGMLLFSRANGAEHDIRHTSRISLLILLVQLPPVLYSMLTPDAVNPTFCLWTYALSGEASYLLALYVRFGFLGFVIAGLFAGGLLYMLGRLLREAVPLAAPVFFALLYGCLYLLCGNVALPAVKDIIFFLISYAIVSIAHLATRKRKKRPPIQEEY